MKFGTVTERVLTSTVQRPAACVCIFCPQLQPKTVMSSLVVLRTCQIHVLYCATLYLSQHTFVTSLNQLSGTEEGYFQKSKTLSWFFLDNVVEVPNCIEWYPLKLHTCVSSVCMDETNLCAFTEPAFRQNYNPWETLIIHSDATSSTQLFLTALLSMSSVRL